MALVNYMGNSPTFLSYTRDPLDITSLGLAGDKEKSKKSATKSKTDTEDYKGLRGDAQFQADIDNMFESEYKEGMKKYGNDADWYHQTDEYKELAKMQRYAVGNEAAAVTNLSEWKANRAGITGDGTGQHTDQLVMTRVGGRNIPRDVSGTYMTKGQYLNYTADNPNYTQDGRLEHIDFDNGVGTIDQLRDEINKEYQLAKEGETTIGRPLSAIVNKTTTSMDNLGQLKDAGNTLLKGLSPRANYAMDQEFWGEALNTGTVSVPKGLIKKDKDGNMVFDEDARIQHVSDKNPDKSRRGDVVFEKLRLSEDDLKNDQLMAAMRHYYPIRFIQDQLHKFHAPTWRSKTTMKKGDGDGDGGWEGPPTFTAFQQGITPDAEVSQVTDEIAWRPSGSGTFYNKKASSDMRRLNKANKPTEMRSLADDMRGKSIGEVMGVYDDFKIGNTMQDINSIETDWGNVFKNQKILDVEEIGEYLWDKGDGSEPQVQLGMKVKVILDDDQSFTDKMFVVDEKGNKVELTDPFLNVDWGSINAEAKPYLTDHGTLMEHQIKNKKGEIYSEEELETFMSDSGFSSISGDHRILEMIIPVGANMAEFDKSYMTPAQLLKHQGMISSAQKTWSQKEYNQRRARNKASINVVTNAGKNVSNASYSGGQGN